MFNPGKAARVLITATLIIGALTGSAGSRALAAPEQGCSGVAPAGNDALNALHDASKDANDKLDTLRALATEELATLTDPDEVRAELRGILRDAREDLDDVRKDARRDISERVEAAFEVCAGDEDEDEAKTMTTLDLTKLTADLTAIVDEAKKDFAGVLETAAADTKTVIAEARADDNANNNEKNVGDKDKDDHAKKDHEKKDHDHEKNHEKQDHGKKDHEKHDDDD